MDNQQIVRGQGNIKDIEGYVIKEIDLGKSYSDRYLMFEFCQKTFNPDVVIKVDTNYTCSFLNNSMVIDSRGELIKGNDDSFGTPETSRVFKHILKVFEAWKLAKKHNQDSPIKTVSEINIIKGWA